MPECPWIGPARCAAEGKGTTGTEPQSAVEQRRWSDDRDDDVGARQYRRKMLTRVDVTLDCADPDLLAEFWKTAAGYVDEPPPLPFTTREEWLAQFNDDEDDEMGAAWLHDPTGLAPRLCLLQVPEPKTAKNRLHVDLRVSGEGTPEQKWTRVTDEVARLSAAGAVVLQEFVGHHVVMADPEGNEFCVA